MALPSFKLPSNAQRTSVVGRTGSGKTQFGAWLLSEAPFDKQPYVVIDYKHDDLLVNLPRIETISLNYVPRKPGLYIVQPHPSQHEAIDAWLRKVWDQERVGLLVDEAYALPKDGNSAPFTAILTQGRSKRIPAIVLSQRPSWISRFVFSEADFYAVFHLNDKRDQKTVAAFMPENWQPSELAEYHSKWFDVKSNTLFHMEPVPSADDIMQRVEDRLKPRRTFV